MFGIDSSETRRGLCVSTTGASTDARRLSLPVATGASAATWFRRFERFGLGGGDPEEQHEHLRHFLNNQTRGMKIEPLSLKKREEIINFCL